MSCTKHHEDIIIAILAENYPKTIYDMVPFGFANTVANSTGVQGAECKIALDAFGKGSNGQTIVTMQLLGKNYPNFIYGMAIFGFRQNLTKTKEMKGGLFAKLPHSKNSKGQNAKRTSP